MNKLIEEMNANEISQVSGGRFFGWFRLSWGIGRFAESSGGNRRAAEFNDFTGDYYFGSRNGK